MKIPKHLGSVGKKFWRKMMEEREFTQTHHFELLAQACKCLDRVAEAREELDRVGSYYKDRWGTPHQHPALKGEQSNKILFARLMRELNLDIEQPEEPRPPALY